MDDDRRPDPTSRLLGDFVRHVSEHVVVPEFAAGRGGPRRRSRSRPGFRVLVAAVAAAVVVVAAALVVVYGPRSSRLAPSPTPATQPAPGTTQPTPVSTSTTSVTPPSVGTRQVTYNPFTATGIEASLHVTSQVTGTCIRYGGGVAGRFSYRCFGTQAGIYDPCFAGPSSTTAPLVCPMSPTSDNVVQFTVTSVTADEPAPTSKTPWAMQLSGGEVCLLVSAAWGGLGPYACQRAAPAQSVADCHAPQSGQPSWTAACQVQQTDASPFASRDVTTLWY